MAVAAVAERMGLHENTARFHLEGLVGAGLVRRGVASRRTPGRPAAVYEAVGDQHEEYDDRRDGDRGYRLLARILAGSWSRWVPDAEEMAVRSGEDWGRYLVDRPAPYESLDREQGVARLVTLLGDLGFSPETERDAAGDRVLLHDCPFRDIAANDPGVTCAVHLGLMRGALQELGTPTDVKQLDPFVEPRLCVARLE